MSLGGYAEIGRKIHLPRISSAHVTEQSSFDFHLRYNFEVP
jgi:hypothetical protein